MPEILKYRFIRDVAAGRAEVASRPEVASPVTFAKLWELHLHSVRGTAFDPAHKVADRDMGWYLDEHVDMLSVSVVRVFDGTCLRWVSIIRKMRLHYARARFAIGRELFICKARPA